jgi:peptide/nickel transport system ATP-binding protein
MTGLQSASRADPPLLELERVSKVFPRGRSMRAGTLALDDVSLVIPSGAPSITAIAGESGSGKTTLAHLVLGLLTPSGGAIRYRGEDVAALRNRGATRFRREVQAILQDPYDVFNPFYTVDHVFDVMFRRFELASTREQRRLLVNDALRSVGLDPDRTLGRYPHQLSGGQAQRVMVARSLMLRPRLIVADEPVSMVDATLRATILETLVQLKETFGVSFLYITHDLATAYRMSDEILIVHRGRVVERGPTQAVIDAPQDPYTRLLIDSIPEPDPDLRWPGRLDETASEERGPSILSEVAT